MGSSWCSGGDLFSEFCFLTVSVCSVELCFFFFLECSGIWKRRFSISIAASLTSASTRLRNIPCIVRAGIAISRPQNVVTNAIEIFAAS